MTALTFDTHAAVEEMKGSGLAEAHAESIVAAIQAGMGHLADLATKEDLKDFPTREDLTDLPTRADLKAELENFATKEDLKSFATKEDLKEIGVYDDSSGNPVNSGGPVFEDFPCLSAPPISRPACSRNCCI